MAKRKTISYLQKCKTEGNKFSCLTAYDASFAKLFDEQGIDLLLVGDSLGMVLHGKPDTLAVTVDDIVYHVNSVVAGNRFAFVMADMPFMSYATVEQACRNAGRMLAAGANMVKLEGGKWLLDTCRALLERGVPVCAHLGLTPQSVNVFGGYKVQGKQEAQANELIDTAIAFEQAGCQMLLLECVPATLAKAVTDAVNVPVIGIGAGKETDGQILVMHDVLGISANYVPSFSKNFLTDANSLEQAIQNYHQDVKNGVFPAEEHAF